MQFGMQLRRLPTGAEKKLKIEYKELQQTTKELMALYDLPRK
jgi:hypothetical protein